MEFEKVIRERSSVRKYSGAAVDAETLESILEAGRLAPTAKNLQPVKIYVVRSDDGLAAIDRATKCRYGAGTVLAVCGAEEAAYHKESYSTYEMDSTIVAVHMMLEATNVGVDNIFVEAFDADVLRSELQIPAELTPVCLLMLGYRTEDCPVNPNHTVRKSLSELVEYL